MIELMQLCSALVEKAVVENCERKLPIFLKFSESYPRQLAASKVTSKHIVNTHFRYQLRKVDYRVCIFYFNPIFYTIMLREWE